MQYLTLYLLNIFLDLRNQSFQVTHYRIVLQVQTPRIHNTSIPNNPQNIHPIHPYSKSHSSNISHYTRSQTSNLAYTTQRTIPHINTTYTQPFTHQQNIPINPFYLPIIPTYKTVPPSTTPHSTISTLTFINSSTSISEPIKFFDDLDHIYTPKEYLQKIEARVTFSLGLQPTSDHEYKNWHARRMAFIQCSLTGTALSCYICLNDTYKQDWHAFVQAFKKQFSSQKNAHYAQVEALILTKKDFETVRHFAFKVQQLVEKGWCNENASTINSKCNEIFLEGLPKNLKGFANKRQVEHTSTVLEPSIPFHTLVKLVDTEDLANDKIRTHDGTLKINNITKHLQTQTLDSSQQE